MLRQRLHRAALLPLAVSTLLAAATPAAAEHAQLTLSYTATVTPVGAGYLVVVYCAADVVNYQPDEIPLSTTVTCNVNGASATRTQPGPHADVIVTTATVPPIVVCISGSATILDLSPPHVYTITAGPRCYFIGP